VGIKERRLKKRELNMALQMESGCEPKKEMRRCDTGMRVTLSPPFEGQAGDETSTKGSDLGRPNERLWREKSARRVEGLYDGIPRQRGVGRLKTQDPHLNP